MYLRRDHHKQRPFSFELSGGDGIDGIEFSALAEAKLTIVSEQHEIAVRSDAVHLTKKTRLILTRRSVVCVRALLHRPQHVGPVVYVNRRVRLNALRHHRNVKHATDVVLPRNFLRVLIWRELCVPCHHELEQNNFNDIERDEHRQSGDNELAFVRARAVVHLQPQCTTQCVRATFAKACGV
jgi:hypothetical protein